MLCPFLPSSQPTTAAPCPRPRASSQCPSAVLPSVAHAVPGRAKVPPDGAQAPGGQRPRCHRPHTPSSTSVTQRLAAAGAQGVLAERCPSHVALTSVVVLQGRADQGQSHKGEADPRRSEGPWGLGSTEACEPAQEAFPGPVGTALKAPGPRPARAELTGRPVRRPKWWTTKLTRKWGVRSETAPPRQRAVRSGLSVSVCPHSSVCRPWGCTRAPELPLQNRGDGEGPQTPQALAVTSSSSVK